jgi:arginine deiminase
MDATERFSGVRGLIVAGLVLSTGLLVGVSCRRPPAGPARVISDIDPLRSVIVLAPSSKERRETYSLYGDSPTFVLTYEDGLNRQHRSLTDLIRNHGVRVLDLAALLDEALISARREGRLEQALAEIFPEEFSRLKNEISRLTADAMLGRDPDFFFRYDAEGALAPLIPTSGAFIFTRDFAVSTPAGIIITNGRPKWREQEHRIGRFIFRHSPSLRDFPIAFDAEAEGVRCDGGDIIVKDARTLLMGIGNLSDREAAVKIAQKLGLDVLGVAMPPIAGFSGVNFEIMHLDTVFNFVDQRKVLTVPYFFEKRYAVDNPVVKYFQAVQARRVSEARKGGIDLPVSLKAAIQAIPKIGWLTLFKAGTGDAQDLDLKLCDYLQDQGYEIIPVGGERGGLPEDRYIDDRVLYELSLQAANVVQLGPGTVVAYAHNPHSIAALRDKGIKVLTVEGKYLADGMGGPHCLTMPLSRSR